MRLGLGRNQRDEERSVGVVEAAETDAPEKRVDERKIRAFGTAKNHRSRHRRHEHVDGRRHEGAVGAYAVSMVMLLNVMGRMINVTMVKCDGDDRVASLVCATITMIYAIMVTLERIRSVSH